MEASGTEYVITDVIPPDEYADHVNNSVYTNFVAVLSLQFATQAAELLGYEADPAYAATASSIYLPFDSVNQIHPEYDGYSGAEIKQADVVLLGYPLMMSMTEQVRYGYLHSFFNISSYNDLVYYSERTDPDGPAMTFGMHAIAWLELGYTDNATEPFIQSYANIQPPFNVWSETPTGGTSNFITGAGGFLQGLWAGWGGFFSLFSIN